MVVRIWVAWERYWRVVRAAEEDLFQVSDDHGGLRLHILYKNQDDGAHEDVSLDYVFFAPSVPFLG